MLFKEIIAVYSEKQQLEHIIHHYALKGYRNNYAEVGGTRAPRVLTLSGHG
jgi:hypothetical protein